MNKKTIALTLIIGIVSTSLTGCVKPYQTAISKAQAKALKEWKNVQVLGDNPLIMPNK